MHAQRLRRDLAQQFAIVRDGDTDPHMAPERVDDVAARLGVEVIRRAVDDEHVGELAQRRSNLPALCARRARACSSALERRDIELHQAAPTAAFPVFTIGKGCLSPSGNALMS